MIEEATEPLPHAFSVVDVRQAGLPLVYVNAAWESLTGYSRSEVIGRNSRLLQGPGTEEAVVAQLVHAIREQRACQVVLTNYGKGGERFRNGLSLHPVSDSNGEYRYIVGLSSDADSENVERTAQLSLLDQLIPSSFDSGLLSHALLPQIDRSLQLRQFTKVTLACFACD